MGGMWQDWFYFLRYIFWDLFCCLVGWFLWHMHSCRLSNAKSCLYIYSRYHTMTDVCTTVLLPIKNSSDDNSGFRHGFGAEGSLPLAQSTPVLSHDTTRLCQIVVTLWDGHMLADAVRTLSWIFSMYFLLTIIAREIDKLWLQILEKTQ